MKEPKIDKNIPIPERGFDYAGWSAFLQKLQVGDSFRFKRGDLSKLKLSASAVNLDFEKSKTLVWEAIDRDEIRVWRQGPPGPDEQDSPLTT